MTEPPPSDPKDLLHIELLPRGRARSTTRHSRAITRGNGGGRSRAVFSTDVAAHASLLATVRPVTASRVRERNHAEYMDRKRSMTERERGREGKGGLFRV